MKADMHPTEYIIPLIHERHRDNFDRDMIPDLHPTVEPEDVGPKRDPFYSNAGMLLYMGYLKNYPSISNGTLKLRCSLYYNSEIVVDDLNTNCSWISDAVHHGDSLSQTAQNRNKLKELVTNEVLQNQDVVLPINQTKVWHRDFYNMIWDTEGQKELVLFIEVVDSRTLYPEGIIQLKINSDDGTIRYGAYNLPVYKYPLKDPKNIENNDKLDYMLSFVINEPKPQVKNEPEEPEQIPEERKPEQRPQPTPSKPTEENTKQSEPEEEEKEAPKPETPERPIENSNEIYISNTLQQYDGVQYDSKEIIVLYID